MSDTAAPTPRVPRPLTDVQRANLQKGREALVARRASDKAARERGEEVPARPRKKKAVVALPTLASATKGDKDGLFSFMSKLERMTEEQRSALYKLPFVL